MLATIVVLLASVAAPSAFAYAPAPLQIQVKGTTIHGNVKHTLITFRSDRRIVTAEILAPTATPTDSPGVLFVHWLGSPATTNHTEFESDAHILASRGATCVLVDAMWSTVNNQGKDWFSNVRSTNTDYDESVRQVVDLRRALDVLLAQPGIDAGRIAYVGHDFGAMYGAVLAGVDARPKYYVLMAGVPSFADWYLLGKKPAKVEAYRRQMAALDPGAYLSHGNAQAVMFQFADHDRYVPAIQAMKFFEAAPTPKAMFMYDADHSIGTTSAFADRLAWLEAHIF